MSIEKNEVLMQLFIQGPTWDGNLVSKSDRNELLDAGLASKWEGWNYLTPAGVEAAVRAGEKARDWADKRWYRKATIQD